MTQKLTKPLKLELELEGQPYIVTISPAGVRIIAKGKRTGAQQLTWLELVSGEAQLHRDLVRSLAHRKPPQTARGPSARRRSRNKPNLRIV
jgi:hypothetical protein